MRSMSKTTDGDPKTCDKMEGRLLVLVGFLTNMRKFDTTDGGE